MAKKPAAKAAKKPAAKKVAVKKPVAKKPVPQKVAAKPLKKPVAKKVAVKKPAPKKPVSKKATKPVVAKKPTKVAVKPAQKSSPAKKKAKPLVKKIVQVARSSGQQFITKPKVNKNLKLTPFLEKQRKRLLDLKDTLLDSMSGVARGNLHAGTETSAFGMHQADAGSDAYDRDFALSMLSKEQGSLYEIDEALKRIEDGTYGLCEICQKAISQARLEALPFTRTTVDCQSELEKRQHHHSVRPHINSLFGLTEEEEEENEEEVTES